MELPRCLLAIATSHVYGEGRQNPDYHLRHKRFVSAG